MTTRLLAIMTICTLGGLVTRVLPASPLTEAFATFFRIAQPLCLVWWAWEGYRNRRPYWTRESWTRFLLLSLFPLAAMYLTLSLATAIDERSAWVGGGGSAQRLAIAAGALLGVVIGGGGAGYLLYKLSADDAQQFDWPWRRRQVE